MTNYKTTIGGAISTIGKGLIMLTVLPQLAGTHSDTLWYLTLAGYIINIVGEGLAKFFAADAASVKALEAQINTNTVAIADTTASLATKKDI